MAGTQERCNFLMMGGRMYWNKIKLKQGILVNQTMVGSRIILGIILIVRMRRSLCFIKLGCQIG